MNRAEIKTMAKQRISGKIGILFLCTIIVAAISFIANLILGLIPFVGSLIASIIVTPAFALSMARIYLDLYKNDKKPDVGEVFSGFDDFWSAFKVTFLSGFFTFLWALLFIVPGIIKAISYSMSMYILAENPGMPALQVISKSKEMMHGHKMDYFVLSLSFIGWLLLVPITCYIAYIWVGPYMETTYVAFYNSIKPQETIMNANPYNLNHPNPNPQGNSIDNQ